MMPNLSKDDFHIGKMRWKVYLANQEQLPDPNSPAVVTQYVNQKEVWAEIKPVSTMKFLLGVQTEFNKITHEIIIRALGYYPDKFTYVIRNRINPDQSTKTEIFRVHRSLEIGGRQRFLKLEAELITSGDEVSDFR